MRPPLTIARKAGTDEVTTEDDIARAGDHDPDRHRAPTTWIDTDRWLARFVARPVLEFMHVEQASGFLLLAATIAALVWANSAWDAGYAAVWATEVLVEVGPLHFAEDLGTFVNDALMALFFFTVGLEIKRELVTGELRDPRAAALPAIAAVGGMVLPALVYVAFNAGGPNTEGWGIPMATDIAFALGVVAVLGPRVPVSLKVFLLTLAIVDDVGAIVVIAVAYTGDLSTGWLALAGGGLVLVALMRRARVWYVPAYAVVGAAIWFATHESGVHATIAGVALGLMTPAEPLQREGVAHDLAARVGSRPTGAELRAAAFMMKESTSVAERLEHLLHPWTSFVVLPVFALANAGVPLGLDTLADAASSSVAWGIALGLVVGKLVGVSLASWIAVRTGLATLPRGVTWPQVIGIAGVAGIGFTVSLFITNLAFEDPEVVQTAKIAVLLASATAAVLGALLLRAVSRRMPAAGD